MTVKINCGGITVDLERIIAVRNNKIVYRDGDICIKIFGGGFSKADILNEALNLARAEEAGINVPKFLELTEINGKTAMISEYIQGKTLERIFLENPNGNREYMELFVKLQIETQERECRIPGRIKDKMSAKIGMAELSAELKHKLYDMLDKRPECGRLCHGDFDFSNVIITPDGVPYILDWPHAAKGDAAFDAAKTYLLFQYRGDSEKAKEYLDLFLSKGGAKEDGVRKWLPIVAAAETVGANEDKRKFFSEYVKSALCVK